MKELKDLVIHRDGIRQMSKEQIEELNTQHGWFSNRIDDFDDLNTCYYDELCIGDYAGLWSWRISGDWEYFLPVKSLQNLLEEK